MRNDKEYIEFLENKVEELSKSEKNTQRINDFENMLKYQEEFLMQKFGDKDFLISENKRLCDENSKLVRTVLLDSCYINYLLNSSWWKLTLPFRKIYRKIKGKKYVDKILFSNIHSDSKIETLDTSLSIIIFTKNAGNEFSVQLENLRQQKYIKNVEIIVVDRASQDETVNIAKKYGAKIIKIENMNLSDSEVYEKILPKINGEYIAIIDQNKVIDSKYWAYQVLKPVFDKDAAIAVVLREKILSNIYTHDLKNRIGKISGEEVLFLPENRDIIQYINPIILDKTSVIIKKKISNLLFI